MPQDCSIPLGGTEWWGGPQRWVGVQRTSRLEENGASVLNHDSWDFLNEGEKNRKKMDLLMQYLRGVCVCGEGILNAHTQTRTHTMGFWYMDAQLDARFGDCLSKAGAEYQVSSEFESDC